jgi:DNA-binding MarR family transcriptional regulator
MRVHSMQLQIMHLHLSTILDSISAMTRTSAPPRTAGLVREWRALLDRHASLSCALEKALNDQHHIGLSEFEVLDRLVDANCGSYRMQELAKDIHLSQSALSRAVARLESDGLVTRGTCADDRRGVSVCLTGEGALMHREALPTHREVLRATWDRTDS